MIYYLQAVTGKALKVEKLNRSLSLSLTGFVKLRKSFKVLSLFFRLLLCNVLIGGGGIFFFLPIFAMREENLIFIFSGRRGWESLEKHFQLLSASSLILPHRV